MLGKMIENTKDLNMVADRLRARGEISRLQELCKEWLIPEKDMQDFLQGKRLRLAEAGCSASTASAVNFGRTGKGTGLGSKRLALACAAARMAATISLPWVSRKLRKPS